MSYQNFKQAMELAPKCEYYTTAGGKSEQEIEKAEQLLGLKFSDQCLEFYREYGYLSFFGVEIFGIDLDDDSDTLEGNSVAYALHDREEYHLPDKWVPIYDFEDGNIAFLDYGSLNSEKEPRVIMAFCDGNAYEEVDTLAEDLGEFILQLVEEQLAEQEED